MDENMHYKINHTGKIFGQNKVEDGVGAEFQFVLSSVRNFVVQYSQLGLALVEFRDVFHLQSDTCVRFVHFNAQFVPDALHLQFAI
ncbi:unnamed protein product, partial [Nesidiocoris tenuis]